MNYELKDVKATSLPYTKNVAPIFEPVDEKYGIDIMVTTGIVGQNYSGFVNNDAVFCEILNTDSIPQIQAKMQAKAIELIAEKYPNT